MPGKNIAPATFKLLGTEIGLSQFSIQFPYQRIGNGYHHRQAKLLGYCYQ